MNDYVVFQTASVFHAIFQKKITTQHKLSNPIKKCLIFIPRAFGRFPKIEKKRGLESAIVVPIEEKTTNKTFLYSFHGRLKVAVWKRARFRASPV